MNWLKLITRGGRQSLARELMKEYLTTDRLAECAVKGVNSLLVKVNNKEVLESVASNVNNVANLTAKVADAVRDGEVTADEAATICATAQTVAHFVLTEERIDALIEKAVQYVP